MKRLVRHPKSDYSFIHADDPEDFQRFAMSNAIVIRIRGALLAREFGYYKMNKARYVTRNKKRDVDEHLRKWTGCTDCPLGQHPCVHSQVFFRGYIPCDILFIGQAPGESEDTWGRPFVGPAGAKLNEIIETAAVEVFPGGIEALRYCCTNTVLCYPMNSIGITREPTAKEIMACRLRLEEFIAICEPEVIITVGRLAESKVPKHQHIRYYSIKHPSAIIRIASEEDKATETRRAALIVEEAIRSLVPF